MSDRAPSDLMTLAGLALANGPWLAVRLRKLAEHAGQPLPEETVESAVLGSSRVLAQVLDAEGRPSVSSDHNTDPAAQLGREQAGLHQQAGLDLPASLKAVRLMRRAFDDLVRESWVDKDSRARAHEDVEHFFERVLLGHCLAWIESAAVPPAPVAPRAETERLAGLVARREDELRRAMYAARQAVAALRQSRERATALAAELAQAQAWGKTQRTAQEVLKAELAAAKEESGAGAGGEASELATLKAKFAVAQNQAQARLETLAAKAKALETQRAELADRLAEARSSLAVQREVEEARELALKEIDNARSEAAAAREELRQALLARREAEEAQALALQGLGNARTEAEAAREELRKVREAYTTLASEAEDMRTHLADTGSRLTQASRAEEAELKARLAQALERIQTLEAEQTGPSSP